MYWDEEVLVCSAHRGEREVIMDGAQLRGEAGCGLPRQPTQPNRGLRGKDKHNQ